MDLLRCFECIGDKAKACDQIFDDAVREEFRIEQTALEDPKFKDPFSSSVDDGIEALHGNREHTAERLGMIGCTLEYSEMKRRIMKLKG